MEIILNTFGSSLNWDNGGFVVTNQAGRKRIPLADIQSIILTKGVSITSDAVLKAIENEIEIHFFDRKGTPQGVVWSNRFGSISTIRKGQLAFCRSSSAVTWIKDVVMRKVENQQALLLMTTAGMHGERSDISLAIERLEKTRATIAALQGERVQDVAHQLRGIEGSASKTYFAALNLALPQRYRFVERSQHPARDVVNALLNYGYGMLYSKVESALIRTGIDPYVGVFHRDQYNRPVLVYDFVEQYRVWADYVVFTLCAQGAVTDDFFSIDEHGACWLEAMGRRVLIQSINDYLSELITATNGERHSREHEIFLNAQSFAQRLKAFAEAN